MKKFVSKKYNPGYDLFSTIDNSKSPTLVIDYIRGMLNFSKVRNSDTWRGLIATPPGSLLETVLDAFRSETNIPLEIPFFVIMHLISAKLLKRNISMLLGENQIIKPDLWTVVLAPSGASKTFSASQLSKATKVKADFPNATTAAKFVEELKKNNNSFWLRDEFGQFLKSLTQEYNTEMKDYLLRLYDGEKIDRITKKETIEIENPALTILGMTVYDTFSKIITMEDMTDGFAQRFNYVISTPDPNRKFEDFAIYKLDSWMKPIRRKWNAVIKNAKKDSQYIITDDAESAFKTSFRLLFSENIGQLPESFHRRVMFRSFRYALIYHLLLKKDTNLIDEEDIGWSARLASLHIKDGIKLLDKFNLTDLNEKIDKIIALDVNMKKQGKTLRARDVCQKIWGIKTANEARALMSVAL